MSTTTAVNVPRLAISMSEGILAEWLVADGAAVSAGQPLYILETEKVETEIEAPADGIVRLLAAAGETYPVGTCIAEIATTA